LKTGLLVALQAAATASQIENQEHPGGNEHQDLRHWHIHRRFSP
jgi:hypothetical protein